MTARGRFAGLLAGLWLVVAGPAMAADSPFSDWAAFVVAGDWHAHSGGPSEAFDNSRRDVSLALERAGFARQNLREYSVRPERYKDPKLEKSSIYTLGGSMDDLAARATGGCLAYFSSHGSPYGVLVDQDLLTPGRLASMLDEACGKRPTIVVLSACFSGVFVPSLAKPYRMVLTAARPDRSSFGCGEADKYPYFDECFLQATPGARDFIGLADAVRTCVAVREAKEGMSPPSEPQLYIGGALRPLLPLYALGGPDPPAGRP